MLGVVVWTDPIEKKAIIWCEDHGDLAYIGAIGRYAAALPMGLDEGDLIQFDLADHASMRLAQNARRVARHYCCDLGDVVSQVGDVASDIIHARERGGDTVHSKGPCNPPIDLAEERRRRQLRSRVIP